jgi:hypothetical protein
MKITISGLSNAPIFEEDKSGIIGSATNVEYFW